MSMMDRVRATGADQDIAVLNAVPVTIDDLVAARSDDCATSARLAALERWQEANDPNRLIDRAHLLDAAALATLVETEDGVGFDDVRFGELVAFVAELPW